MKPFRVEILCVCVYGWVGRFITTNTSFNRFRLSVSYWVAFINCVFLEIRLFYVSCLKLFTIYPCCYPFSVYRICTDVPSFILDIGGLCLLFFLDHSGWSILLISMKKLILVTLFYFLFFWFPFHWFLLVYFLLSASLIPNLILLRSENILCMISVTLSMLRFVCLEECSISP